jgi:hypothetical protein
MELVDNAYVSDNQQGAGLYVWNLKFFFFLLCLILGMTCNW